MLDYRQVEALVFVVREGSFKKAAERLGLSQPAISERIRLLEEQTGQPLIVRRNPVEPTAAGQRIINHFHQVALMEQELLGGQLRSKPEGRRPVAVPIAVNYDSLATWFIPAISPVLERGTSVVELKAADQTLTVDFLREGRVLACVTSQRMAPSGCKSIYLGTMNYHCVSTRDFRERHFPKGPELPELLAAPAVSYGPEDTLHDKFLNSVFKSVHRSPIYAQVPHLIAMKELVLRGFAYALLPRPAIQQDLENEVLVDILPDHSLNVRLYWQHSNIVTPILNQYTEAVCAYTSLVLDH